MFNLPCWNGLRCSIAITERFQNCGREILVVKYVPMALEEYARKDEAYQSG